MVWEAEHKDKWRKVMEELHQMEVCELAEWCCKASPVSGFRINQADRRFLFSPNSYRTRFDENKCFDTCRWCLLYYSARCALEVEIMERTLARKRAELKKQEEERSGEPVISSVMWADFVRNHIQQYHDAYQFSVMQVMVPMLGFIEPAHLQCSQKRVHAVTFLTVSTSAEMSFDSFQQRTGRFTLAHPSYHAAKYREKQREHLAKRQLEQQIKDKLKEQGMML